MGVTLVKKRKKSLRSWFLPQIPILSGKRINLAHSSSQCLMLSLAVTGVSWSQSATFYPSAWNITHGMHGARRKSIYLSPSCSNQFRLLHRRWRQSLRAGLLRFTRSRTSKSQSVNQLMQMLLMSKCSRRLKMTETVAVTDFVNCLILKAIQISRTTHSKLIK